MRGLAICAGVGGLELGIELVVPDFRTVCYVERETFAAARLVARMADGSLRPAPIWDDVSTFNGRRWRGRVDFITAGFPCQPWSAAGKGAGVLDERWIWQDIIRVIREVEPGGLLLENVGPLVSRGGLAVVLGSLADCGFDAEWDLFAAADVGASHRRERVFILAHRNGGRLPWPWPDGRGSVAEADRRDDVERRSDGELADTESLIERTGSGSSESRRQRRAGPRVIREPSMADAVGQRQRATRLAGRRQSGTRPESRGPAMANADGCRRSRGRRPGGVLADADGGTVRLESERQQRPAERSDAEPRTDVSLFPPAPGDGDRWRAVLADRPDLAPAISIAQADRFGIEQTFAARTPAAGLAPQSGIRRMADGVSPRVDQLRAFGNGVVPLAAAYAFVTLAARIRT